MSSYQNIRPGLIIVNGVELVGTVFNTVASAHRTILDKVMIVNYSSSTFYVTLLIRKLGQTTNDPNFQVLVKKPINAHQTYILEDELRGESMDFPARMVGDVFNAGGTPTQTGRISIFVTGTRKRS